MILKTTIGQTRVTFSIAKIAKIMGVNSYLDDNNHILMWDFDKTNLKTVEHNLGVVQDIYDLSEIHILETNHVEGNFIAYCFTRTNWPLAIEILSATKGVDWQFVRISVFRGWFTLRTGSKKSGTPHIVSRLPSDILPDCSPDDLDSWVEYETLDRD